MNYALAFPVRSIPPRGEKMKRPSLILVATLALFGGQAQCQVAAPMKLVGTYELPADVKGNFDHFGIDLKGGRLFATAEGYHAVVVFDLQTGKLINTTDVIGRPRTVLCRETWYRIY